MKTSPIPFAILSFTFLNFSSVRALEPSDSKTAELKGLLLEHRPKDVATTDAKRPLDGFDKPAPAKEPGVLDNDIENIRRDNEALIKDVEERLKNDPAPPTDIGATVKRLEEIIGKLEKNAGVGAERAPQAPADGKAPLKSSKKGPDAQPATKAPEDKAAPPHYSSPSAPAKAPSTRGDAGVTTVALSHSATPHTQEATPVAGEQSPLQSHPVGKTATEAEKRSTVTYGNLVAASVGDIVRWRSAIEALRVGVNLKISTEFTKGVISDLEAIENKLAQAAKQMSRETESHKQP